MFYKTDKNETFTEPNDPFHVGVSIPNHYHLKSSGAALRLISHPPLYVTEDDLEKNIPSPLSGNHPSDVHSMLIRRGGH